VDGSDSPLLAVRPVCLKAALVAAGVGILAASAWISVPFYPVPMTMQTLAVLMVGGLLGPRLGVAAVAGYLGLGLLGAPIFHNGLGGAAIVAGPTGGYLAGFVPAVLLIGLASRRAAGLKGVLRRAALLICGAFLAEAAIYALGLPWLALVAGLSLGDAVASGLIPFVLGDLVKMAVGVIAVQGGRSLLSRGGLIPF
jgi:biotin transport system substrate-specific component